MMNVPRSDTKKRVVGVLEKDYSLDGIGMKVKLIDKEVNDGSVWLYDDQNEKKLEKLELAVVVDYPSFGGRVPKALICGCLFGWRCSDEIMMMIWCYFWVFYFYFLRLMKMI